MSFDPRHAMTCYPPIEKTYLIWEYNNKHLLIPKERVQFGFPETLNVSQGEAEGNIEVEGKQNSLFPMVLVILYLPTQK